MRRRGIARWAVVAIAVAVSCLAVIDCYQLYRTHVRGYQPPSDRWPERGIDISAHNGDIDFTRVAADGISFVMIKATEGTDFADRRFIDNHRRALDAGLCVGAYHFFRFDTDGTMQAVNFLQAVNGRRLHFPLAIDVERYGTHDDLPRAEVVEHLKRMVERLEYYGYDVMFYTTLDDHAIYIADDFPDYPIWLAQPGSDLDRGVRRDMWQYSQTGQVDGIKGNVDLNTIKALPTR